MSVKIAVIQSNIFFGKPKENYYYIAEQLKHCKAIGSDLAILPEMWTTGYDLEHIREYAQKDNPLILQNVQQLAKELEISVVMGSMAEWNGDSIYNTSYVLNRKGEIVGKYRKCHLFRLMNEDKFFSPGDEVPIFDLGFGPFSVLICYDLRFPEIFRTQVLKGAKMFILPAEWPHPRLTHWQTLLRARAIENQVFVVGTNRVGHDPSNHFFGHSMIIDPWGEIIAEGNENETIITGEIDLEQVDEIRKKIPCLSDRRVQLYKI